MLRVLGQLLLFPFKCAAFCIELLGRTIAIVFGLISFGIGAILCLTPLILIGAPICLLSAIVVVKAL